MKNIYHLSFRGMGCAISVQLETEMDGAALLNSIPAQVEAAEARLSRFRPQSELMKLNAQAGKWVETSPDLYENISAAKQAARRTSGRYNPLVLPALLASGYDRTFADIQPPQAATAVPTADWRGIDLMQTLYAVRIPAGSALDLGGIAKGWMAARLADTLAPYGACLVNIGGDMVARGAPQDYSGWDVAIEDPATGAPLVSLWLRDACLMTSGVDYRRWATADGAQQHHIIDPRTGAPAETDVLTVSVLHPQATTAEAYAKAVLLRGAEDGLNWLQSQWNASGMVVRRDGAVLATPTFANWIQERTLV